MNIGLKISTVRPNKGETVIFWLGQAGFAIKDSDNNLIVIDPYLSDCGERMRGFKRLSPKLIAPHELEPDIYITTHIHFDHFDFDTIPIVASYPDVKFFGPRTCVDRLIEIGVTRERVALLEVDKEVMHKDIMIKAVFADHGQLAPDAVGIIMDVKGTKLYFSGDTAYRPDKLQTVIDFKPDIAVLSVNGKFGNLDNEKGAMVAREVGAGIAIPCHFWTFKEHGGDPQGFEVEMKRQAPDCRVKFMHQGEMFTYKKVP